MLGASYTLWVQAQWLGSQNIPEGPKYMAECVDIVKAKGSFGGVGHAAHLQVEHVLHPWL